MGTSWHQTGSSSPVNRAVGSVRCDVSGVSSTLNHTLMRGIRAERVRAGLTQAQLAERLKWSRKTVMGIETGDRQLLAHELSDVCRALGVGLRTLLVTADEADLEALEL